jgi:uncharacterized protein
MNVEFEATRCGDAPLLMARPAASRPRRAVLWFHGLGADAAVHRKELAQIAGAGFLAVGVDAAGHGARRLPDLDARIAAPRAEAHRTAIELAVSTAREVPALLRWLVTTGRADAGAISLAGISMGGYVAYRALVEVEPGEVQSAVAILGSPEWPHPDSPHAELDAFCATALLSITAERDENVPPGPARALHARLDRACPGRHRYLELPGAVHLMNAADWHVTMAATLAWLDTKGAAAPPLTERTP